MKQPTSKTKAFLRAYGLWMLPLLAATACLRLIQHFTLTRQVIVPNATAALLQGLLNDELFTLAFLLLLSLPAWLLWQWRPAAARGLALVGGVLFLLISSALERYYTTTKTVLGADLFGYSLADIKTTVGSSAGFSAVDFLPLLVLTFFVAGMRRLHKRSASSNPWLTAAGLGAGAVAALFCNSLAGRAGTPAHDLSLSKPAYFLGANFSKPSPQNTYNFTGFPLQRTDASTDALTSYFTLPPQKPNIVILLVEGLGRDFTGEGAEYGGFTPFLDSLAKHSLCWTNFLSTAGRSFAGLPSVLGSLPFGSNGFNELGAAMPDHQSLISLLKSNSYRSHFFYGGNANFDKQDLFLERQGIDYILDENKFGPGYNRNFGSKYSWGYADGDLYKRSLEVLQAEAPSPPQVNVYVTLSSHEPFAVPQEELYAKKVAAKLAAMPATSQSKYVSYPDVWRGLLYTDESIRNFFSAYAQRPGYANTIFIITGDHRLIPVQEQNRLSRFRVPLLIYSPLLKQPAVFPALSSHFDVAPSLVQLLRHHPGLRFPSTVHWMGKGLDTSHSLQSTFAVPLMRNKNQLEDFIEGDVFLSANELYRINSNGSLAPLADEKRKRNLQAKLDSFRQLNQYLCSQNKLYKPETGEAKTQRVDAFTPAEQKTVDSVRNGNNEPDTLFARARRLAASGNYGVARLLCRFILHGSPNYHDVRILYGRTFSWEKNYREGEAAFAEVLRRNPSVEDAYLAWIDAELWSGRRDSALLLARKASAALPNSQTLKAKTTTLFSRKPDPTNK